MFEQYANNPYVRALLDAIAWGEGATYTTVYGGGSFSGNQHPRRRVCAGAYCSDAAGRYQFMGSTWMGLQRNYGFNDFSPRNQDLGAIALIAEKGALTNILAGDFDGAVSKIRGVWPSLPGGKQQTRTWTQSRAYYNAALAIYGGSAVASSGGSSTGGGLPTLTGGGGDGDNSPVGVFASIGGGSVNRDEDEPKGIGAGALLLLLAAYYFIG